ncbi:MAG TPA: DUF998 domain-containing protein [Ktedonobacterales bacterium]|nr:DUF998 domain-containing protein [Ktedonobacterales bacterium]
MRKAQMLGALTIAGIVIYLALDVVAQLLPPHYSPVRQPESDLAVGPYGYVMTINFVVRGCLSLALVAGLMWGVAARARSTVGIVLIGIWAVGAFLLALFPTDVSSRLTIHGDIHLLVALVAFCAVALGELLVSLRIGADARWSSLRPYLLVCAVATLAALLAEVVGVRASEAFGGLTERIFLGLALLWMLLVAVRLVRLESGKP